MENNAFAKTVVNVSPRGVRYVLNVTVTHDGIVEPKTLRELSEKVVYAYQLICKAVGEQLTTSDFTPLPRTSALERYNESMPEGDVPLTPASGYTRVTVWSRDLPLTITDETNLITGAETLWTGMKLMESMNEQQYIRALDFIASTPPSAPPTPPPNEDSVTLETPTQGILVSSDKPVSPLVPHMKKVDTPPPTLTPDHYGHIDVIYTATLNAKQRMLYVPAQGGAKTPHDLAVTAYNYQDTEWMATGKHYAYAIWKLEMMDKGVKMHFGRSDKPMGSALLFHPKQGQEFSNNAYDGAVQILSLHGEKVVTLDGVATTMRKNDKGFVNPSRLYLYTIE